MRLRRVCLSLAMLSCAGGLHAGTLSGSDWSPAGCGARPEPPQLDLRDPLAYGDSAGSVDGYRANVRTYLDCLAREANGDMRIITRSAAAAEQAAREAEEAILADVQAANDKFAASPLPAPTAVKRPSLAGPCNCTR
jgi:hypothetical protein